MPPKPVEIGYFNGIKTSFDDAYAGADALQSMLKITVTLMYNHTHGYMNDISEVFAQRDEELDPSNYPVNISATIEDYRQHDLLVRKMLKRADKVILVAHSQGNLFANHAVNNLNDESLKKRVSVVHVAPASRKLNGGYVLADKDRVITNLPNHPPPTVKIPPIRSNLMMIMDMEMLDYYSYHSFRGIYLNRYLRTRSQVLGLIKSAGGVMPESRGGVDGLVGKYKWEVWTYWPHKTQYEKGIVSFENGKGTWDNETGGCGGTFSINNGKIVSRMTHHPKRNNRCTKRMVFPHGRLNPAKGYLLPEKFHDKFIVPWAFQDIQGETTLTCVH